MKAAKAIIDLLRKRGERLVVVESITGGRIASALTSIPGASAVFFAGLIAYDKRAKKQFLEIDTRKIPVYSRACAEAMANTWRTQCAADYCLASTGEAEDGKQHYLALSTRGRVESWDSSSRGRRNDIQETAARRALEKLQEALEKEEMMCNNAR